MTCQNKRLPVSSECNIFNFTPNFHSECSGTKCKLNWEIEIFHWCCNKFEEQMSPFKSIACSVAFPSMVIHHTLTEWHTVGVTWLNRNTSFFLSTIQVASPNIWRWRLFWYLWKNFSVVFSNALSIYYFRPLFSRINI